MNTLNTLLVVNPELSEDTLHDELAGILLGMHAMSEITISEDFENYNPHIKTEYYATMSRLIGIAESVRIRIQEIGRNARHD